MESGRASNARFRCRLEGSSGRQALRQRVQGRMGAFHPPRLRRHAVQMEPAGGREGAATGRLRPEILALAALGRRSQAEGVDRGMNAPEKLTTRVKLPSADGKL